ncbi:MAG: hypothetical protein FD175_2494 [Beijerinckiaceae bacterium]|nr:MAG: hypothetical protein FD175_2494 [Beijerinckiaceae bacterium]
MGYPVNYPSELFERHKDNFDAIYGNGNWKVKNDVQMMLCFLWAFFVLSTESFDFIDEKFEDFEVCDLVSADFAPKNVSKSDKAKFLRNALSHGNFIFHGNLEKTKIVAVTFWNSKPNKRPHEAAHLSYDDLLKLLNSIKQKHNMNDSSPKDIVREANSPQVQTRGAPVPNIDLDGSLEKFVRSIETEHHYFQSFN